MRETSLNILDLILSRTSKNTSLVILGNLISSVTGIIFTIFAARILGPESWGIVAAVGSLIPIFVAIGDLGLGASFFQYAAGKWKEKETSKIYATVFTLRLLLAILFSLFILILSPLISRFLFGVQDWELIAISVFGFFAISLLEFQVFAIESKGKWRSAAFYISLTNIVRVLTLLILSAFGATSLQNVLYVFVGSSLLVLIFSLVDLQPRLSLQSLEGFVRKFFSFSAWMGSSKILSAISSRVDILILIQLLGPYETGIYSAAARLAMGVPIVIGSFATVIASRFASEARRIELIAYFKKSVLLSILFSIGLVFGYLVSPWVINLFGLEYQRAGALLQLLFIALIPFALSTPAVNVLIYNFKRPKIITYLSFLQLIIVLLVNYFYIPVIGLSAPILAVGLSNTLTFLVTYYFALNWLFLKK